MKTYATRFRFHYILRYSLSIVLGIVVLFPTCFGDDLVVTSGEVNCFIQHLKILKKLESTYPKHVSIANTTNNEDIDCEEAVTAFFNFFEKKVRQNSKVKSYGDCVIYELKKHDWFEEMMLQMVYTPSRTLSAEDRLMKLKEADERALTIIDDAIDWCAYKKEFMELFDLLTRRTSNSNETDLEDYCAKKYVVDKGLIDTKLYQVVINPKNLNVVGINCQNFIKKISLDLQEILEKSFRDEGDFHVDDEEIGGVMKKYHQVNFFERILSVYVLGKLDLTTSQKESEQMKFVETVVQFIKSVFD